MWWGIWPTRADAPPLMMAHLAYPGRRPTIYTKPHTVHTGPFRISVRNQMPVVLAYTDRIIGVML